LTHEGADLFGEAVALGQQVVKFLLRGAAQVVGFEDLVNDFELLRRPVSLAQTVEDASFFFADDFYLEHLFFSVDAFIC